MFWQGKAPCQNTPDAGRQTLFGHASSTEAGPASVHTGQMLTDLYWTGWCCLTLCLCVLGFRINIVLNVCSMIYFLGCFLSFPGERSWGGIVCEACWPLGFSKAVMYNHLKDVSMYKWLWEMWPYIWDVFPVLIWTLACFNDVIQLYKIFIQVLSSLVPVKSVFFFFFLWVLMHNIGLWYLQWQQHL